MGYTFINICLMAIFTLVFYRSNLSKKLCFLNIDEDVKIAPSNPSELFRESISSGEEAADAYTSHCEKGNIDIAKEIGGELAARFLEINESDSLQTTQARILFAYVADQYTEKLSPDSILSQAVISSFYNKIRENNPKLIDQISDSAAFSLYILAERGTHQRSPGHVFSELCSSPDNPRLFDLGQNLYNSFVSECSEIFSQAKFC